MTVLPRADLLSVKVRISVRLGKTVLKEIFVLRGDKSQSEFIYTAVTERIKRMRKKQRDHRETELINNSRELAKKLLLHITSLGRNIAT